MVAQNPFPGLDEEEQIILTEISRECKSDRMRIFTTKQIQRKAKCRKIDVVAVMRRLEAKGLARRAGPTCKKWAMTHEGKKVEHEVAEYRMLVERDALNGIVRLAIFY
jgi:DNA-binding MarR family transcriptional regulator